MSAVVESAIVDIEDVALPELTGVEARELTRKIRVGLEHSYSLIITAYQGRAWIGMGYSSWDAYCQGEFGSLALQPPREERREVIMSLRDAGMSLRAIGAAVGLGHVTVSREVNAESGSTVPNGTVEPDSEAQRVIGVNGKSYAAAPPKPSVRPKGGGFEDVPLSDELLGMSPDAFGIKPFTKDDLPAQSPRDRNKAVAALNGGMDRPLPMLIKLAGEIVIDSAALAVDEGVDVDLLGELASDAGRGVLALSHVLARIDTDSVSLDDDDRQVLNSNLQDAIDELGRFLDALQPKRRSC